MPLTAADVQVVTFSKPPIGKRGYNEVEVDAFLDLVGAELARLTEDINGLRRRIAQLEGQLLASPSETGRVINPVVRKSAKEQTSPDCDHDAQSAKVLRMAQQIADRITGEAKADAERLLGEARTKSEQLLSDARARADGMVHEARTRAQTILNDVRTQAETLGRQSREKAASLERDAARKHDEVIGSISQEKSVLENKVAELRTFENEYHSRLRTYLEVQLRELDGRASGAPAGSVRTPEFGPSGLGAHTEAGGYRSDPKSGTAGDEVPRLPVQPEARNKVVIGEPHLSETRWEPAV